MTVALEAVVRGGRPGGSHRPRTAIAWLLGLAIVVGVGVIGRAGERPATLEPPVAGATVDPAIVAVGSARSAERSIVILSPEIQNAVITSRRLTVRGYVVSGTGPIAIVLESSGSKTVATRTVEPLSGSGGLYAGGRSYFSATFPLSNPRPGGRMVVQIIAYDLRGMPLDSMRRRIRIGAIEERRAPVSRPAFSDRGLRPAT